MLLEKDIESIQNNIHQFIEKYGQEGFLELYFTNLIYEMVKDNIRSKTKKIENSPGMQYYFDKNGDVEKSSKLKEFDEKLKIECNKKAKQIVELIIKEDLISKFGIDFDEISASLAKEMDEHIKDIFKKVIGVEWGEKVAKKTKC
jgi:hypothetical protein